MTSEEYKNYFNKTERIYSHTIEYYLTDAPEDVKMDDCSIEHVEECLRDNITQGEVIQADENEIEYRGLWRIRR